MFSTLLLLSLSACPPTGAALRVDTQAHALELCESGQVTGRYAVAIGSGGAAGKRVGWAQTPRGTFTLLAARPSQYHLFIPLKNPDAKRFSQWAIGVHGPPRANKHDGPSNVATDWTLGCIAVATDAEIEAIAAWQQATKATVIQIE